MPQITLCVIPILPSLWVLAKLLFNDVNSTSGAATSTAAQLLLFSGLGVLGYLLTNRLVPSIKYYMIKRGICGKDLGKKGSQSEDVDV
jgi:hypothetical protein